MQNPVQSAQEKTAFETGLYGYPYVRAPKKGRRAWFSHLPLPQPSPWPVPSCRSARPQVSLSFPCSLLPSCQTQVLLQGRLAKAAFLELAARLPICPPKSQGQSAGSSFPGGSWGLAALPSTRGRAPHCPAEECYPSTDVETERAFPASLGGSPLLERAALVATTFSPLQAPRNCLDVCVS